MMGGSGAASRTIVAAAAGLCLAGYVFIYATGRSDAPIKSDGFSYYVYLPAWFIFQDPSLRGVAADCCGGRFPEFTAIIRWPETRRWVNAHPIGPAVMQAPFFAVADLLTVWSNLSRDGFTLYYQHAAGLAGLFWTIAGLWVLRMLLLRHFPDGVTAATLAALLLGTNLYHYATYDSSFSHAYSFFLIAALLDLTERWHEAPSTRLSVLVGIVCGLIVLTRHTNAQALVIFPLYGMTSGAAIRSGIARLRANWPELVRIAATAGLVFSPQLAIYYQATGRLLVNSYGGLGFTFASPKLFEVLFSVQKGVFFWSPLLLAAVVGIVLLRGRIRAFLPGACVFLAVNTYVIASWWDWQFGASYGHRGFVDALPIMALGLGRFLEWGAQPRTRRLVVTAAISLAVALSVVQMLQYWNDVLPSSDTTWEQYRSLFLRLR